VTLERLSPSGVALSVVLAAGFSVGGAAGLPAGFWAASVGASFAPPLGAGAAPPPHADSNSAAPIARMKIKCNFFMIIFSLK
jgi:hypothetical protein